MSGALAGLKVLDFTTLLPGPYATMCLADMGDSGMAFVAAPQMPPRNITWAREGRWVHLAKAGFEKYFLRKMKTGNSDPFFERWMLKRLGVTRVNP